jgi:hypothetical protein
MERRIISIFAVTFFFGLLQGNSDTNVSVFVYNVLCHFSLVFYGAAIP